MAMEPHEGWVPSLRACEESMTFVLAATKGLLHPDLQEHLEGIHIYLKAAIAQMDMEIPDERQEGDGSDGTDS